MTISPSRMALAMATAILVVVGSLTPAHAGASERMKTACTSDYLNFCSQYPPDSTQMVECMIKNEKRITKACREVVEEEGIPSGKRLVSKSRGR